MKNLSTCLLTLLINLLAIGASAQPRPGIRAGLNYASLSSYDGDNRLGFHAGVFVHTILNKQWRLQPELLYSGEGQHYTVDGAGKTIALGYIALPVLIQYFPTTSFYLESGPQLAVLAGAHSKGSGDDHLDIKRSFANSQFGINLGGGAFLKERIGLYGRYYFGFTNVTPLDAERNRSQNAQLGVSFRFK